MFFSVLLDTALLRMSERLQGRNRKRKTCMYIKTKTENKLSHITHFSRIIGSKTKQRKNEQKPVPFTSVICCDDDDVIVMIYCCVLLFSVLFHWSGLVGFVCSLWTQLNTCTANGWLASWLQHGYRRDDQQQQGSTYM